MLVILCFGMYCDMLIHLVSTFLYVFLGFYVVFCCPSILLSSQKLILLVMLPKYCLSTIWYSIFLQVFDLLGLALSHLLLIWVFRWMSYSFGSSVVWWNHSLWMLFPLKICKSWSLVWQVVVLQLILCYMPYIRWLLMLRSSLLILLDLFRSLFVSLRHIWYICQLIYFYIFGISIN